VPGTGDAPGPAEPGTPELSVVVPAHRAAEQLHESLGALLESDLPRARWELIVANDGADPETAAVARRYADEVVVLDGKPRGPGYARNRGARVARGDTLVFVDADVRVHRDTLRKFRDALAGEPDVAAVFGSYDDRPPAPGWVSAYRNLLHHHVHQRNAGEAETFWAGCGAVRSEVFRTVGGYDEWHFSRPQVEDIELGRRIRRRGHRILLRADIQATHLKRWTLAGFVRTDFNHRGVPWTRLLLHEGANESRGTLNLSWRHRACVALAGLVPAGVLAWLALGTPWPLAAALSGGAGVVGLNAGFFALVGRSRSWACALCAVPLHLVHCLVSGCSAVAGWLAHVTVGPPLPPVDAAAFREAGMDTADSLPSPPSESVWYRHDD
jgi:GT2 family glycosyltransferase